MSPAWQADSLPLSHLRSPKSNMLQLKKKKNGLGTGRDGRETMVAWTRVEAVGSDSIQCILGKSSQQDLLVLVEVKEREVPGMALRRTAEPSLDT